jgi:carbamoyl-phosphate synthase large subunit/carbamoyl-phosphate synthase small subunit
MSSNKIQISTPLSSRSSSQKRALSPVLGVTGELSLERAKTPGGSATDRVRAVLEVDAEPCWLTLSDGTKIGGFSFGARNASAGEVVFNTGMVGYPEALTDPSYRGQILVLTFPLQGNYGVPDNATDPVLNLPKFYESNEIHIRGLVVCGYTRDYSHWNAHMSLGEWLSKAGIPAIFGVDTRALTKKLREHGTMLGKIEFEGLDVDFQDPSALNLVAEVSIKVPRTFKPAPDAKKRTNFKVLAFDCGIKFNIIRTLVIDQGVELTVVPYDFPMTEQVYNEFDAIFISNGPGNPEMATSTINALRTAMEFGESRKLARSQGVEGRMSRTKPIFGICLGNQLLALAAGAKTYKLKYGNRGMNQPCIDMRTTRCFITAQNHGYAVDDTSLPDSWQTFFMNANDFSNEGIIHKSEPYFSVQFHPEAAGGPMDTPFLFDMFVDLIKDGRQRMMTVPPIMFQRPIVRKCILVGSGGLSIGQAGEFDYSGSQAIKALKEEGIEVVLINPNIATVQTMAGFADQVYFLPVTPDRVLEVIEKERPDSIIVSMGGQTALNVGVQLWRRGDLQRHNVKVLGTPIDTIIATEDREIFAQKLAEIGEYCAKSKSATSVSEAIEVAKEIGYPVLVRAAFALGGLGSGFAANEQELQILVEKAFAISDQVLIDEDLRGWKEIEYEVVRDCKGNTLTVCNMENFDPLGIHTGDSIVIAPSQTLSNEEYFMLRKVSIKVIRHLGVVGECNIQYALHPGSTRYCIIEVNARLSRSSALASKATGYPLAYVAAKLALGKDLVSVKNSITKSTTACFEPSLDYVVAKVPRWDLKKFSRVNQQLGSAMKSVGEVMAIGRSFEEVIQKAVRSVSSNLDGFGSEPLGEDDGQQGETPELDAQLSKPTHLRLFAVARALERGYSVDRIYELTKIDRWFLFKLQRIQHMKTFLAESVTDVSLLSTHVMRALKSTGFSDAQIAKLISIDASNMQCNEQDVRKHRIMLGVTPFVKQIDTLAAEFPAHTNYLYTTYNATSHDLSVISDDEKGVIVLGGGPYCIGSSVEFDWCAVSCVRTLRADGIPAIVINCNPETVSTDYDESDRLYFEELTLERVMDIYDFENARGVVVSVGGQIPNNLALPLYRRGVKILGTHPTSIDIAEDRNKFSALLDKLGVDQPEWASLTDLNSIQSFANKVGFPVLVRPSYVLSGAAMRVASNINELVGFIKSAVDVNSEHPVVVSKFFTHAKEIEFDGVAQNGRILNYAISEHVEYAGVHSGDATLVLPAQKLYVETIRQIKRIAGNVARELNISGPFNMQFLGKNNAVKVIECNLRASRSFPFVSKTFQTNFIELATRVMTDMPAVPKDIKLLDLDYVGVKVPMFSFGRLQGADPTLGVEMVSTGEVACFGQDVHEAMLLGMLSAGFKIPKRKTVLFTVGPAHDKKELAEIAAKMVKRGYKLWATHGTAVVFKELAGIDCILVRKGASTDSSTSTTMTSTTSDELQKAPFVLDLLKSGAIDWVINVQNAFSGARLDDSDGYRIRRMATDFGIALTTNAKVANMLAHALLKVTNVPCLSMADFYTVGAPSVISTKPLHHHPGDIRGRRVGGTLLRIQQEEEGSEQQKQQPQQVLMNGGGSEDQFKMMNGGGM